MSNRFVSILEETTEKKWIYPYKEFLEFEGLDEEFARSNGLGHEERRVTQRTIVLVGGKIEFVEQNGEEVVLRISGVKKLVDGTSAIGEVRK